MIHVAAKQVITSGDNGTRSLGLKRRASLLPFTQ